MKKRWPLFCRPSTQGGESPGHHHRKGGVKWKYCFHLRHGKQKHLTHVLYRWDGEWRPRKVWWAFIPQCTLKPSSSWTTIKAMIIRLSKTFTLMFLFFQSSFETPCKRDVLWLFNLKKARVSGPACREKKKSFWYYWRWDRKTENEPPSRNINYVHPQGHACEKCCSLTTTCIHKSERK